MKMLSKIFDVIVKFVRNHNLGKKVGMQHKLFKGSVLALPSKIFDRMIDFMIGARYDDYIEILRNMLKGGVVDMPLNIFDWKELEKASAFLRLYMEDCHDEFRQDYVGSFPVEDFKEWFHGYHMAYEEQESAKKSVSEALLSDDLPKV